MFGPVGGLRWAPSEPRWPSQPQIWLGSFSLHQLLFTIYMKWERYPVWFGNSGTDLYFERVWGRRVTILRYIKPEHILPHPPPPHPSEPALLWTYNQGGPCAMGLSHHAAHQVPGQQLFCLIAPVVSFFNRSWGSQPWSRDVVQGTLWTSEQQGAVETPGKKKSSVSSVMSLLT